MAAATFFLLFVQLPLTIKYFLKVKEEPLLNRHLLKRSYIFPLISFPLFYASNYLIKQDLDMLGDRYLSKLTDYELENFELLYR